MATNGNSHVNVKQCLAQPGECLCPWRGSQEAAVILNASITSHATELSLDLVQTLPPQTEPVQVYSLCQVSRFYRKERHCGWDIKRTDGDPSPQIGEGVELGTFKGIWWEGRLSQTLHGLFQMGNSSLKPCLTQLSSR